MRRGVSGVGETGCLGSSKHVTEWCRRASAEERCLDCFQSANVIVVALTREVGRLCDDGDVSEEVEHDTDDGVISGIAFGSGLCDGGDGDTDCGS